MELDTPHFSKNPNGNIIDSCRYFHKVSQCDETGIHFMHSGKIYSKTMPDEMLQVLIFVAQPGQSYLLNHRYICPLCGSSHCSGDNNPYLSKHKVQGLPD